MEEAVLELANGKEDVAVKELVKIFMKNETYKTNVFQDASSYGKHKICAQKSSPSVLRGISKDALQELTIEKLSSELEVSITKLLETIL